VINLFNINNHIIDTSKFSNLLHDSIVEDFENSIASYVGAKYAVSFNSATSAIFLALLNKNTTINVPSMIPPVVVNAIITSGNRHRFVDDVEWIGDSYILHKFSDYKIIDSAQKLQKNQFIHECDDNDLMIFSFYPTKPVGSSDGGMIVSNDKNKINYLKELAFNGMSYAENNWDRKIKFPGYKMYMNSIQCQIAMNNFKVYSKKLERLNEIRTQYNKNFNMTNTSDHLYRLAVKNRDDLMVKLKQLNIQTGIHYKSLHNEPVYINAQDVCTRSTTHSMETISIPFNESMSDYDVNYVIDSVMQHANFKS
jgi:dTDP-4-amino-4,6-dideoxygalactose transaminase